MPRAAGLFRRAILESGAAHHVSLPTTSLVVGRYLAAKLDVAPTREAVAAVPVERVLKAQAEIGAELFGPPYPEHWGSDMVTTMPWQPVVDGEVVPEPPIARIAAGASADVEVVVGTNTDDWRLFLAITGEIGQVTAQDLVGDPAAHGRRAIAAYGLPVESALPAYRARYPEAGPGDLLAAVQTDWWVRVPALRLADAHARAGGTTSMYEFAWAAPGLGAVHALEVPFVFDTLSTDARLFGPLLGENPPQELADTMHAAWVSFAGTGDPGWPEYDLTRRLTMRFDTTSQVVEDPRAWERSLWEGIR
jgi:carboxylesterase type B